MTIDWSSNFPADSEVRFGTAFDNLSFSTRGSASQYSFDGSYFGKQKDYISGFLHTVYLYNLQAG